MCAAVRTSPSSAPFSACPSCRYALNPTVLSNWASGDPCSGTWTGVSCSNGAVVGLSLPVGLVSLGTLPDQLGALTSLTSLSLPYASLSGTVPALGNLAALTSLFLTGNRLSGAIGAQLSGPSALTSLFLSQNQFSGDFSELLRYTGLRVLDVSFNQINGTLPTQLGALSNLTSFRVSHTAMSGSLPTTLGLLTALKGLYLDNCSFTGSIPPQLAAVTGLISLNLTGNAFTGAVDSAIGSLTGLSELSLSYNSLSGTLPMQVSLAPAGGGGDPPWPRARAVNLCGRGGGGEEWRSGFRVLRAAKIIDFPAPPPPPLLSQLQALTHLYSFSVRNNTCIYGTPLVSIGYGTYYDATGTALGETSAPAGCGLPPPPAASPSGPSSPPSASPSGPTPSPSTSPTPSSSPSSSPSSPSSFWGSGAAAAAKSGFKGAIQAAALKQVAALDAHRQRATSFVAEARAAAEARLEAVIVQKKRMLAHVAAMSARIRQKAAEKA